MSNLFDEHYNTLTPAEKQTYLTHALIACAQHLTTQQNISDEISYLKAQLWEKEQELDKANRRIEKAKIILAEKNSEIENSKNNCERETYKNLQIVRDRVYSIGSTAQIAATNKKTPIVELNNILAAIEIIIQQLQDLGLWKETDVIPTTTRIPEPPKKKNSTKKTTKSKKDPNSESLDPTEECIPEQLTLEN